MNTAEKSDRGNNMKKGALVIAFVLGFGTGFGAAQLLSLPKPKKNICCSDEGCWCYRKCGDLTDQGDC
jgi:hypothetical protein